MHNGIELQFQSLTYFARVLAVYFCRSSAWHVFLPIEEEQQSRTNSTVPTFVKRGLDRVSGKGSFGENNSYSDGKWESWYYAILDVGVGEVWCKFLVYLTRLQVSKTEDWNLAVQTLGLQPGSFSRLFLRESLSL